MRKVDLFGISVLALMAAAPAAAQTAPTTDAGTTTSDDEGQSSGDIIVTASKREQTLQDTPISVSVTSAESIERSTVRDLLDLQTLVPSLKVGQQRSSANTSFSIRGFGNGANNAGIEPSVGVFIDGVYRSRSAAQIGDLVNISRVEVLRGPQSTLFGKNASAGIISIVTQEPQFEFGGNLEASYGNYNAVVLRGIVTGPISDTIAVSIAGNYNKRDGYARYTNLNAETNDRNRYGGRAQIVFQPSSDFKIRLIADYDKIDEICCVVANVFDGPTGGIVRALGGNVNSNQPFSYDSFSNYLPFNKIDNYGGSGQIDFNITDTLALTSITAYRGVRSRDDQDSDFTSADLIGRNATSTKIDTFTQEIRLASNFDGPLNFLLGGFFFDEKINQTNQLNFGTQFRAFGDQLIRAASGNALNVAFLEGTFGALEGAPNRYTNTFFRSGDGLNERYRLSDRSFSIFGTVDFELTDGLTLTGGINYTDDRKRFSTATTSNDVFSGINLDAPQYAPFRNQLLLGGALASVGINPNNMAQVTAFATNPNTAATFAAFVANANANQNNPAANPLGGLRPFQFLPAFFNVPNAVEPGRTNDTNFSYTGRLAYKLSRQLNVYGTYATGFKASSINLSRDSRPSPGDLVRIRTAGIATTNLTSGSRLAGPENAEVYEVGVKGNFPGFQFNLAVFRQTLRGFQSNVFQGTGFVLGNAEKQTTKGFELEATLSPVRNLVFTGSLTYLDAKYDLFTNGSAFNPLTNTVVNTNLTGQKPSGQSEYSIAIGSTYTLPVGSANVIFHGDFAIDSAFIIAAGLPNKAAPESLNASVALQLSNGLEIAVWGRNLTEPRFNSVIFPGVAQGGTLSGYPSQPRTYGGQVRFKF